jgi:F-type H+-transporting ATPase subunit gamma
MRSYASTRGPPLPSKQDLRRRIRSVRSTEQITKAMKMVAAAKLRRAQTRILEARPYAAALDGVLRSLASRVASHRHELLVERPEHAVTLVVVTADKGLCGAFNANIFRRRSYTTHATYPELMNRLTPEAAFELARALAARFAVGETDGIYLLYNRFRSILKQEVTVERLLPIERAKIAGEERPGAYIFEPSPQALLGHILPRHVQFQVLRALLDSQAAEQASRMTAMDAASKNAADMIDSLTLTYNRARQASITKELIEIVSGAQALAER